MKRTLTVLTTGVICFLLCLPAQAEWISADGSGELAPEVQLVSHSPAATVIDVTIHGFYSEPMEQAGAIYQQLSFGDNAALRQVGKPELPVITSLVGIPDRSDLRVSVQVLESQVLTGYRVWPAQEPTKDGEQAPPFAIDSEFYSGSENFPEASAVTDQPQIWRDMRLIRLEVRPISFNPGQGTLTVATRLRVQIDYFGSNPVHEFTRTRLPINPKFQQLYRAAVINFDQLGYPLSRGGMDNPGVKYLVVTTTPCLPYIQDLVNFRHAQGFETDVQVMGPGFATAEDIKAYITQLYNAYGLEYVLLVGDAYYSGGPGAVDVPMYWWVDSYSDSWYTMMDGPGDYLADLAIGRIVYDNATELTHQLDKTMNYLLTPEVSNWAEHTLLVAHQEQYPLKYTQCKEEIRTFPYAIQTPIFGTAYGGAGATNQDVINYINANSSGILNYRGHGSDTEWWQWGPSGSFTATHVYQLTNYDRYFVHYDVCCDNMNIVSYSGDCLCESFMKAPAAAVAVNSAIIPSYTIPNHDYDKEFYKAIYNEGINNIGYASNYANITVYQLHGALGESNIRTYLWLGDACIDLWTNTMQTMTVTHPSVMLIGTSTLTVSTGIQGALVCAQNEEVYAAGYTDNSGSITLEFTPGPMLPATLTITVSAHNYLTYQQDIPVIPPEGPYVVFNSCQINDAVVGNNNGQWDFGETVDLSIEVKNVGVEPAIDVNVAITTGDPLVTVIDGSEPYGTIAAGDSLLIPDGFRVEVAPEVEDQHVVAFTLIATSDTSTWESYFSLIVNSPVITYDDLVILDPTGNNNGALDPGETADFNLTMMNDGHSAAENVSVIMTVNNPLVTISGNPGSFGTLAPGATAMDTWVVTADPSIASGTYVTFTLDITADGGYASTETFDLLVGDERNLPTGPDGYGYWAWDNNDGGEGHAYNWIEIAPSQGGSGTVLTFSNLDDGTTQANLPFSFRYYGQDFTQISICTNGWVAMGYTTSTDYSNSGIPNGDGPANMIAVFWDDLHAGHGGTEVCTYYDAANHYCVVEWYNIDHYSPQGQRETFEVILYDPASWPTTSGDGIILCQYNMVTNASSATFGIENQSQTIGIQYGYNGAYDLHAWPVEAERTITYTTNISGTPDVAITLTPYNPPIQIPANGGSFDYNIAVVNNDPGMVFASVWCMVTLPNGSSYGPVLGPANLTLPVGFSGDRDRTQNVPGNAPSGTYTYHGYIGAYPSVIWDEDSFTFEKLTTGDGELVEGWANYGEEFEDWFAADNAMIPEVYSLDQNYPNPFNPLTSIHYGLPEAGYVKLAVYDLLGRQVALLVDGQRDAGLHEVSFDASKLASGVYIYRIKAGDFTAVKKMILMK